MTTALILYTVGSLSTLAYLLHLVRDIPGDELSAKDKVMAAVLFLMASLTWPIFWGWLIYDWMRD